MNTLQAAPKPTSETDVTTEQEALDAIGRAELEKAERREGVMLEDIARELKMSVSRLYHLKTSASWSTRTLCRLAVATGQGVVEMIAAHAQDVRSQL